jgi:hypothetical protein
MKGNLKAEIIQYAEFCHERAMQANQFWLTIQQFRTLYHSDSYQKEIEVSPYFYTVALKALNNSLILELAKLYDENTKSIRLKALLGMIKENIARFPKEREIPVRNIISSENEELHNDALNETFCCKIPLCPEDELNKLGKRLKEAKHISERLRQLRINIYAHNDNSILENYEQILKENSLGSAEIETLITLAFDISDFVLVRLTGNYIKREYINSGDLEKSLRFVRYGKDYYEKIKIPHLLEDIT